MVCCLGRTLTRKWLFPCYNFLQLPVSLGTVMCWNQCCGFLCLHTIVLISDFSFQPSFLSSLPTVGRWFSHLYKNNVNMESLCSKVLYYTDIQAFIFHPRIYKINLRKKKPNSTLEHCVFSPLSLINDLGFSALCGIIKCCFQEQYILAHV